ncbi:MAG: ATP-binding protein, partial [Candidatus Krumholzibacteriota bacterium]|nr:ATP-binding protein [Candidatus Krumholzibacteriota bacterium]
MTNGNVIAMSTSIEDIKKIRQEKLSRHELTEKIAERVIRKLELHGTFYRTRDEAFYFDETTKRLVRMEWKDEMYMRIYRSQFGLNAEDPVTKWVHSSVRNHARENGEETVPRVFAHYDEKTDTLYRDDFNDGIYVITPTDIHHMPNGTDGVLFVANTTAQPYGIEPGERGTLNKLVFNDLNITGNGEQRISRDESVTILRLWVFSMFFGSILPARPIIALIGPPGSGKTVTIRRIGAMLFGPDFNVTPMPGTERDFNNHVVNNFFVALDNADSYHRWTNDSLATLATGGDITTRVLYTTDQERRTPTNCFTAITACTPTFTRPDVSDRLLLIHLDRIEDFRREGDILGAIQNSRDTLAWEINEELQAWVRDLKETKAEHFDVKIRMADWAILCLRIARARGGEEELTSIFERMVTEQ